MRLLVGIILFVLVIGSASSVQLGGHLGKAVILGGETENITNATNISNQNITNPMNISNQNIINLTNVSGLSGWGSALIEEEVNESVMETPSQAAPQPKPGRYELSSLGKTST